MINKRLTLICGHYGSGKTNIAVNFAFELKKNYGNAALADLDIVNPYFRAKDSIDEFQKNGIRFICSEYANSNVDLPALPQEIYALTDDKSLRAIIDVGGDERGALALGRLSDAIVNENDYDMFLVINKFRPLTQTPEEVLEVMREIQGACRIPFTGIINNSNLGKETTEETVLSSMEYAKECERLTGLPVVCTTVADNIDLDGMYKLKIRSQLEKEIG